MTTLDHVTRACANCGNEDTYVEVGSTSSFGAPDLDLRPPEIQRSTMEYWVQRCRECGFCNYDISEPIEGAAEIVRSDRYRQQLEDPEFPKLANAFLCYALLLENAEDYAGAGQVTIQAAWACDDAGMGNQARQCRQWAIALLQKARENDQIDEGPAGAAEALLADLMRRSGQFDQALETCEAALNQSPEPVIADVLRFQQSLIREKDVTGYTVEDAVQAGNQGDQ